MPADPPRNVDEHFNEIYARLRRIERGTLTLPEVETTGGQFLREYSAVIAAKDSAESAKAAADYVCEGYSDEDVMNTAVREALKGMTNASVNGGKILLRAGTYYTNGQIIGWDQESGWACRFEGEASSSSASSPSTRIVASIGVGDKALMTLSDVTNIHIQSTRGTVPGASEGDIGILAYRIRNCYAEYFSTGLSGECWDCVTISNFVGFAGNKSMYRCQSVINTTGCVHGPYVGGTIQACLFDNNVTGLLLGSTGGDARTKVVNNYFDRAPLVVEEFSSTGRLLIANNFFLGATSTHNYGVHLEDAANSDRNLIQGNQFMIDAGRPDYCVRLGTGCDSNVVINNYVTGGYVTGPVSNGGAGNTVAPNY